MNELTWPCEICGEIRPDDKIWVITYPLKGLPGAERNLKYCNDNKECMNAALKRSQEGKI